MTKTKKQINPIEIHAYLDFHDFFKNKYDDQRKELKVLLLSDKQSKFELEFYTKTADNRGPLIALFKNGTALGCFGLDPGIFSAYDMKDYFSLEDAGPVY